MAITKGDECVEGCGRYARKSEKRCRPCQHRAVVYGSAWSNKVLRCHDVYPWNELVTQWSSQDIDYRDSRDWAIEAFQVCARSLLHEAMDGPDDYVTQAQLVFLGTTRTVDFASSFVHRMTSWTCWVECDPAHPRREVAKSHEGIVAGHAHWMLECVRLRPIRACWGKKKYKRQSAINRNARVIRQLREVIWPHLELGIKKGKKSHKYRATRARNRALRAVGSMPPAEKKPRGRKKDVVRALKKKNP